MLDIGGWEFLLIAILGIIIFGPKDLPGAIRTLSMLVRRMRKIVREFQSGLEEVAREAEFDKVSDSINQIADPTGSVRQEILDSVNLDEDVSEVLEFEADLDDVDLVEYSVSGSAKDNDISSSETPKHSQQGQEISKESEKPEKPE